MTRPLLVALLAATALAAAPALAQQQQPAPAARMPGPHAAAMMEADREALLEARIAGLRAGLRLTDEQDGLFEPVETALRDAHEAREERRTREMAEDPAPMLDFMSRLERRTAIAAARTQEQVQLVEALRPLWDELDESQRATLPVLLRVSAMHGPMMQGPMMHGPMMQGPMMHGPMMNGPMHGRMMRDGMMDREGHHGPDRGR